MAYTRRRSLAERFAEKYTPEPNSGCWLWLAAVNRKGYGLIARGADGPGKYWHATHASLMLHERPRPSREHMALHHCDVPSCVNPDHLYWGTVQDNFNDMVRRGRGRMDSTKKDFCIRGHAMVPGNLYGDPNGRRQCKTCSDVRHAEWMRKNRPQKVAPCLSI